MFRRSLLIIIICALMYACAPTSIQPKTSDLSSPKPDSTYAPPPTTEPHTLPDTIPVPEPTPTPTPSPTAVTTPEPEPKLEPELAATLSTYTPSQGQLVGFILTGMNADAEYQITATHLDSTLYLFPSDDKLISLIPIPPDSKIGEHTLVVKESKNVVFELNYTVQKSEFTRQDLTVTEEIAEVRTDDNLADDNKKVNAAKSTTVPEPLWNGVFIQPVEGRISTEFGQERYTNGEYTSRHSAIDIAAPEGTPIKAAANGKVVFSDDLIVTGKTVIIDHGMWLFTTYCHMSALDVSAGDEVMAGDIIGKVGSTGYSTGPHLHYAASIKSTRINPDMLKERNPLDFLDLIEFNGIG